jgi:hypothetical protein
MDPLLVSAFISMLLAGWNWSQAIGYRSRPWQAHLELIWSLDADDGVNNTAIAALYARSRRRHFRPTAG